MMGKKRRTCQCPKRPLEMSLIISLNNVVTASFISYKIKDFVINS